MKKPIIAALALGSIVIAITTIGIIRQNEPTESIDLSQNTTVIKSDTMKSDFTPPNEPEWGWGNAGPYEHRLMTAISDDGLTWERMNLIVSEQANTPDMILNDEGQILLYYTGGNIDGMRQSMAVAISEGGEEWIFKKIVIQDEPEGLSPGGDPDIVRLDDGTYRLYYTAHLPDDSNPGILFAEGTDGISFTYQGQALYDENYMIMDSITFWAGEQWVMLTLNSFEQAHIFSTSTDGTNFEIQHVEDFTYENSTYFPSNHIIKADGSINLYAASLQTDIRIFNSKKGLEWTDSEATNMSLDESTGLEANYLKDPAVLKLTDGTFLMVYVTRVPESI